MIRLCITLIALTAAVAPWQPAQAAEAHASQWLTNLDEAKKLAKEQNKPLYFLITGTSWCPWCIKLERDVYNNPEFWNTFQDRLIFVKYDIDRKRTPEQTHVMDSYGVMGVPVVLIFSSDGKEIGRLGYPSEPMDGNTTPLQVHSKQLNDLLAR